MTLHSKLIDLLKTDPRFVDQEGELLIAAVQDCAWKLDHRLVRLLLSDAEIKAKFFEPIEDHWIFDFNTFIDYISRKDFLDNSYTRFRNRIGLTIAGKFLRERGEVALVWPYKDGVLEGGQTKEEEKRQEIFFNQILAQDEINRLLDPKVLTSFKRYTLDGEQPVTAFKRDDNGVLRENLILKGNNLLALHTLKGQFRGQVKLIYIDPPYNTGGSTDTFTYNNTFKHSTWLTFIKNRLEVAREFLTPDGFIAVTIDHVELFYLGSILDEIFGRENQVGIVTIYINPKGRQHERFFAAATEYMLVYAKNINEAEFNDVAIDKEKQMTFQFGDEKGKYRLEKFIRARTQTLRVNKPQFWYPIYVSPDLKELTLKKVEGYYEIWPIENGREYSWKTKPDTFQKRNVNSYFVSQVVDGEVMVYHKYYEQQVLKNLWIDKRYFPEFQGTNLLKRMFGENVFSYPKSVYAVLDTLKIMTGENDIILDFFAGSGTTAHAVLELNKEDGGKRKFILCEQMDYVETVTRERVRKVIEQNNNGDFIYCELLQYNQAFIDHIQAAADSQALLQIWRQMAASSFLNWYVNPETPEAALDDFTALGQQPGGLKKQKRLLVELLDKNQLYVNLSEIDDAQFQVSEEDKALNRAFYGVNQ